MKRVLLANLAESVEYGITAAANDEPVGPKFLRITDIQDGQVNWSSVPYCKVDNRQSSGSKLLVGDIVFARTGATTGKSFLIRECPENAVFASYLIRVRPGRNVIPAYLAHFFDSPGYWRQISLKSSGAAQPGVNSTKLKELLIPLPPLGEQKRIAAILDQADELRRLRQRAIDRLKELGQSIFYEMFGDPATNPKKLHACRLGDIIEFVGGSQPPKSNFFYEPAPNVVRFVQIRDFRTDQYKTYLPVELAKRPFKEDDVMIGRYGPPVFQIFRGLSGTYNVALMKAAPKGRITKDFIYYLLQEQKLHGYVVANSERTAGQSGVNLKLLEEYPAFVPPAEMLSEFSGRVARVEEMQKVAKQALDITSALFASFQHRAFRGEL